MTDSKGNTPDLGMSMEEQELNYLLDDDAPEKAAENLRLAMAMLHKHQLPATPLNYALFYIYVSGKNVTLNKKINELLEAEELDHNEAVTLFIRFFYYCGDVMLDGLRKDLLETVAEVIGSLVDVAGKSALSNKQLEEHIEALAASQNSRNVLSVVSSIIHETRHFVQESRQLEKDLLTSSKELKHLKSELVNARVEATTDALTGLNNRRGFDEYLKKLLNDRRRSGTGFSIIMTDLDRFKDVNDNYGHLIGDKVLQAFARLLRDNTRDSDFVARFGGEEFVLLLPNTSLDNAYVVAENIRHAVEKLRVKQAKTGVAIGSITASFGVAMHRFDESAHELIDRCDKAMYRAKDAGRNRSVKSQ